jgi:hypothetical protein
MLDPFAGTEHKSEDDESFLANLAPLQTFEPGQPPYEKPIGALFDKEWIKGARDQRRKAMKEAPTDIRYNELARADWLPAEAKTLDLADWEKDIVMCALYVVPLIMPAMADHQG